MRNDGIRTQGDLPGLRRPAGSHPSESARQSPRMRLRASRLTRSGRDGATSKRPLLDESRDTRGAVSAITGQPLTRLGESAPTSPGFYVIAYDGEAEPYDSVRASGTTLDCGGWPLYAGAARDLRERMASHANALRDHPELPADDFVFACVSTASRAGAGYLEALVIAELRPVWNEKWVHGFGSKQQGSRRSGQQISLWDTLHPGRAVSATLERNAGDLREQVAAHLGVTVAAHARSLR